MLSEHVSLSTLYLNMLNAVYIHKVFNYSKHKGLSTLPQICKMNTKVYLPNPKYRSAFGIAILNCRFSKIYLFVFDLAVQYLNQSTTDGSNVHEPFLWCAKF